LTSSIEDVSAGLKYMHIERKWYSDIYLVYVDFSYMSGVLLTIELTKEGIPILRGALANAQLSLNMLGRLLRYIDSAIDKFYRFSDAVRAVVYEFFREVEEGNYLDVWTGYDYKKYISVYEWFELSEKWGIKPELIVSVSVSRKSVVVSCEYRIEYWMSDSAPGETTTLDNTLEALRSLLKPDKESRKLRFMDVHSERRVFRAIG